MEESDGLLGVPKKSWWRSNTEYIGDICDKRQPVVKAGGGISIVKSRSVTREIGKGSWVQIEWKLSSRSERGL